MRKFFIVLMSLLLANSFRLCASSLEVVIHHRFDGAPLLFDSLRYKTASGEPYSVTRLSYLLSEFSLEKEDGTLESVQSVAFIDAQKRSQFRLKDIPKGPYRALHCYLGPDQKANHGDPAQYPASHPLNPILNRLHWDWEGGYIFLALEGRFRPSAKEELSGYVYHLARDENRMRLTLTAPIDLRDDGRLHVSLDVQSLMNAPKAISFSKDGKSTHSNEGDPLPEKLKANLRTAIQALAFENTSAFSAERAALKPLYMPEKFKPYRFTLPGTFPIPALPLDNPLTEERVALGKRLFHDKKLSKNGTTSCASCHKADKGLSDDRRFSLGLYGEKTPRHSMPLFNLAWKDRFFWDGRAPSLRQQVLEPIENPIEMHENLETLPAKLLEIQGYEEDFQKAFGTKEITAGKIGLALEAHLLTLTSTDSKFDRAMKGEVAFTPAEQRGLELFFMEYEPAHGKFGADCFHCHGGRLFTDHGFHDNGLGDLLDLGLGKVSGQEADDGQFSTPSLRNIALTAPYMHDGRFNTLEEVVAHYNSGVKRTKNLDPNLAKHPQSGLGLSAEDQAALVAFLKTLSDPQFQSGKSP